MKKLRRQATYYPNTNNISELYFTDHNGKIQGIYEIRYPNKNMYMEISYVDGELDGTWKQWSQDKKIEKKYYCKNSSLFGQQTDY